MSLVDTPKTVWLVYFYYPHEGYSFPQIFSNHERAKEYYDYWMLQLSPFPDMKRNLFMAECTLDTVNDEPSHSF